MSKTEAKERVSFGKALFYDTMFQSSTLAYIVQKQAGLYHEVSTDRIMPAVNRLDILLTLTDEEKIEEEYELLSNIVKDSRTDIKAIVNKARNKFDKNVEKRIKDLGQLWSELTGELPEDPEIQEEADAVNNLIEEIRGWSPKFATRLNISDGSEPSWLEPGLELKVFQLGS